MCVGSKSPPRSLPHPLGPLSNHSCPLPCPAWGRLSSGSTSCWRRTEGRGEAVAVPACTAGLADGISATSLVVCPSRGVPAPQAAPPLLPPLLPVNWQQGQVVVPCSAASRGCRPSAQRALGSPHAAEESRGLQVSAGQAPPKQISLPAFCMPLGLEMLWLYLRTVVLFWREPGWRGVCSMALEPGNAFLPGPRDWERHWSIPPGGKGLCWCRRVLQLNPFARTYFCFLLRNISDVG